MSDIVRGTDVDVLLSDISRCAGIKMNLLNPVHLMFINIEHHKPSISNQTIFNLQDNEWALVAVVLSEYERLTNHLVSEFISFIIFIFLIFWSFIVFSIWDKSSNWTTQILKGGKGKASSTLLCLFRVNLEWLLNQVHINILLVRQLFIIVINPGLCNHLFVDLPEVWILLIERLQEESFQINMIVMVKLLPFCSSPFLGWDIAKRANYFIQMLVVVRYE